MELNNILIVCVGNICRSPLAEILLSSKLGGVHVSSAGLSAPAGKSADQKSAAIAAAHGLDLSVHVARQLNEKLALGADLILVMERRHQHSILKCHPQMRGRVQLITRWMDSEPVMDPYTKAQEFFDIAYRILDKATDGWAERLTFKTVRA